VDRDGRLSGLESEGEGCVDRSAGLAALPLGKTSRTVTITSVGATNSPLAAPVDIFAV
jgi:hypothetical protein